MIQKDLNDYFKSVSNELLCRYKTSQIQKTSRNLGDNREKFIHEFIEKILPPKLHIRSGEIWDKNSKRTGEIDRIIVRDDSPCLDFGGKNTFFVEGVFAVVQIKSNLQKKELEETIVSYRKIMDLHVPKGGFCYGGGKSIARPFRILISFEGMKWETIKQHLNNNSANDVFDMICILDQGVLIGEKLSSQILRPASVDGNIVITDDFSAVKYLYYYLVGYAQGFVSSSFEIDDYFRPHPIHKKL